jgi:hypothetical protein
MWKKEKRKKQLMTSYRLNFQRTPAIVIRSRAIRWDVAKNWAEIELAAWNSSSDATIEIQCIAYSFYYNLES